MKGAAGERRYGRSSTEDDREARVREGGDERRPPRLVEQHDAAPGG